MNFTKARQFAAYAWGTLLRPGTTFEKLLAEPLPIVYGSLAILLVGALYTITVIIGYLNGFGAPTLPFLPIAAKDYYLYEAFFTIPVFWICALILAAVVQFFSVFSGGKGKFEDGVAIAGFSLFITIIPFMWIPETIMVVFNLHLPGAELTGTIGLDPTVDLIFRQCGTVLWQLAVTLIGVRKVQRLSWGKTLLIGLIGFIVYVVVFWTYIR